MSRSSMSLACLGLALGALAMNDPSALASESDDLRQAIVETARSQTGLVSARETSGTDASGRALRVGSDRLLEYFHVSAPNKWSDDVIAHLGASPDGLPSWCGIFALWAYRTAGADVGDWVVGSGIASVRRSDGALAFRPTAQPQAGDVGFIASNQHHNIVVSVSEDGRSVTTIDGNTLCVGPFGGQICERTRPRSDFAAFYTIFTE